MKNNPLFELQSAPEEAKSFLRLPKRRRGLQAFLGIAAVAILAGCVSDGSYSPAYRYPGPYHSGGYYYGGIHRGYSYGIQHGFGRSGFGGGGRRH